MASMRLLRLWRRIARESIERFNADDGWPIASHVALSTLMALFPFLIVLAALDSFVASVDLADAAAGLLLKSWPREVSERIAPDAQAVLGTARGGVLGLGIAFAVFFAATGVESMRIGLNRAYRVRETRSWGLLRLESIAWVIVGAIAYLALALPIVLAPLIFEAARESAPGLARVELKLTLLRYAIASFLLVSALVLVHKWLPAGPTFRVCSPPLRSCLTETGLSDVAKNAARNPYARLFSGDSRIAACDVALSRTGTCARTPDQGGLAHALHPIGFESLHAHDSPELPEVGGHRDGRRTPDRSPLAQARVRRGAHQGGARQADAR